MKRTLIILVVILALAAVGGVIVMPMYEYRFGQAVVKDGNFKIYPNENLETVAHNLQQQGYIESSAEMVDFARSNERDSLRVGNYTMEKGSSYRSLLNRMAAGRQTPIRLTFNNFRTIDRLVGAVSRKTLADSAEFMAVMTDKKLLAEKGLTPETLISIFIPNTYEVYWTITPRQFFDKMYGEYSDFWDTARTEKSRSLGLTRNEVSTIASIVDAETNKQDEMTTVAGVYINRLRKGMPMQADPTVKFALQDFGIKRILNRHLEVDSPYNTYKNVGLPPGPICMPSIAAIDATLNYAGHNYYYFCARADFSGYHSFAKTLTEHNRNAKEYQAELNRRRIK